MLKKLVVNDYLLNLIDVQSILISYVNQGVITRLNKLCNDFDLLSSYIRDYSKQFEILVNPFDENYEEVSSSNTDLSDYLTQITTNSTNISNLLGDIQTINSNISE